MTFINATRHHDVLGHPAVQIERFDGYDVRGVAAVTGVEPTDGGEVTLTVSLYN